MHQASDTRERVVDEITSTVFEYSQAVPILKETLGPILKVHRQRRQSGSLPPDIAPKETHTFFVLSEILRRVSGRCRTVLFIDDVQWLDASSIAFLGFLIEELKKVPVFVLLSARTNGVEPPALTTLRSALSRAGDNEHIHYDIPPLSAIETIHVAERYLEASLEHTSGDAEWLQHTSKGIPKYVREVVALLKERGVLERTTGRWRFTQPPAGLVLPPSLKTTTLARLEPLFASNPEGERLLHYAAVFGRRFDVRVISRPADLTAHRAMLHLQRIATATGLVTRVADTTQWEFDHDLTREAILGQLGDLAGDLHRDVAEALAIDPKTPAVVVAHHYQAAGVWRLAADAYGKAAHESAHSFAFEDAADAAWQREHMLNRAGIPADSEERLASAEYLGRRLLAAQRYRDAAEYLAKFRGLGIARKRPRLLHALARAKLNLPDAQNHGEAVEILRAALALLEPGHDVAAATILWSELILAYDTIGDHRASQAAFRKAYAGATAAKDALSLVRLLRLTCIFLQPEKVIETTNQALVLAKQHRFRFEEAACLNNLGTQWWYLHEFGRAREYFESSRRLLADCGGYRKDIPTNNLGLLALADNDIPSARELFQKALEGSLTLNDRLFTQINAATAEAMAGELDIAVEAFYALALAADAAGDLFHSDCVRYNLGRVLLLRGDAAHAISTVTSCAPRHWLTDDDLVLGKRAALLTEAYAAMGREPEPEWAGQVQVIEQTKKPQAWLYRISWEFCDVQFWQD